MATFTGTGADEIIVPGEVSPTVQADGAAAPTINPDTINGKGGDDTLSGGGGEDGINGGSGFDTFVKGFAGDMDIQANGGFVVVEDANGIAHLQNVERLLLNGSDNEDDVFIGNLGGMGVEKIVLDFAGASGAPDAFEDSVEVDAGAGDDLIRLSSTGSTVDIEGLAADLRIKNFSAGVDRIEVNAGKGGDRIDASGMSLASARVQLYGQQGNDDIDGSDGDDNLIGGLGKDILRGGKGEDTLFGDEESMKTEVDLLKGGRDADTFLIFTHDFSKADKVLDFKVGEDLIGLFGPLGGPINEDTFIVGKKAADADDYVIYNDQTGALYVDADGVGGAKQHKVAVLDAGPALTYNDFAT